MRAGTVSVESPDVFKDVQSLKRANAVVDVSYSDLQLQIS